MEKTMAESQGYSVFATKGLNGQEATIEKVKIKAAELWEIFDDISPQLPESRRLTALAKTELESSVMWGVKALSRNH